MVSRGFVARALIVALGSMCEVMAAPAPGSRYVSGETQVTVLSDTAMEVTVGPESFIESLEKWTDKISRWISKNTGM